MSHWLMKDISDPTSFQTGKITLLAYVLMKLLYLGSTIYSISNCLQITLDRCIITIERYCSHVLPGYMKFTFMQTTTKHQPNPYLAIFQTLSY